MNQPNMQTSAAGFSMIEMMIVLIVIAILAGVALPAYQDSMQKARRSDAYAMLLDAAGRQEQHRMDRGTYTLDATDLGYSADPVISEEGYYSVDTIACTAAGTALTNCFILVASVVDGTGQEGDTECDEIVLKSDGSKESSPAGTTYPAGKQVDGRCW